MGSPFNVKTFRKNLSTQWLGHSMCYFEELESTNSYMKGISADKIEHGMLCLADHQTNGRGQYNRSWESEGGENLTFSLVFKPPRITGFHVLTLAFACAVVDYLNKDHSSAHIRWPNDIIINKKKTAGLLTETMFSGNKLDRLIIGIGLNVNQKKFSEDIDGRATSIYRELNETVNRERCLAALLGRIEYNYTLWQRRQVKLLKSINRNIAGYGQWIKITVNDRMLDDSYKLLGINEAGKLLVLNHDGDIESFSYEQIRLITD